MASADLKKATRSSITMKASVLQKKKSVTEPHSCLSSPTLIRSNLPIHILRQPSNVWEIEHNPIPASLPYLFPSATSTCTAKLRSIDAILYLRRVLGL